MATNDPFSRLEAQLSRIATTLEEHTHLLTAHTQALTDQGIAMRDMLRILQRIETRFANPGQNGSNP